MRFISCHIENFGKLHDYTLNFSDGANYICENNGWGKSTFAAFIRAMFYGLEGKGKQSIELNERKRYKPWQGGVFGGTLTFEVDGTRYTLNRIFGDKDANDEFELRYTDTNIVSTDYTDKIGRELFKIDRESFTRTMFIGQSDCGTKQTDDINAKLGNLTDNTNDINNYEKAADRLKNMLNSLSPSRATGSMARRKTMIAEAERKVSDGNEIAVSMDRIQELIQAEQDKLEYFSIQRKNTNAELKKVSSMQELIAKKNQWEGLKQKAAEKKQAVACAKEYFPSDVPERDEIKACISDVGEYNRQKEKLVMSSMNEKETDAFSKLERRFENGTPSEAELDAARNKASSYRDMKQKQLSEQLSPAEKERFEMLDTSFADESGKVTDMIGLWNERNTRHISIQSNNIALTALKTTLNAGKSSKGVSPILILGIVVLLAGIVLAIAYKPLIGIIAAVAGAACVLLGVIGTKKEEVETASPEIESMQHTIDNDVTFVQEAESTVRFYLEKHGRTYNEYSAAPMLQEINDEYVEYKSLKAKVDRVDANTNQQELDVLAEDITKLLSAYNYPLDDTRFSDSINELKNDSNLFLQLTDKKVMYDTAGKKAGEIYNKIETFLSKYGFAADEKLAEKLDEIRDMAEIYYQVKSAYDESKNELANFESVNDVDALMAVKTSDDIPSLDELHTKDEAISNQQEDCYNKIREYNNLLEQLQEQYSDWEDTKLMLQELKETQAAEQEKNELLTIVKNKLADAKEALISKYTRPILDNFNKYYEIVTNDNITKFYLDANAKVTVEQLGKQREIETQSMGYRDLISICLRIALVDAMYTEEKPVLLLDDPFTNLDDVKMAEAKRLITEVAKKYQVVYLTCSNSRK